VTSVASIEGFPKVIRYDLDKLLSFSGLATVFCKGTVFTMNRRTLVSLTAMYVTAIVACVATLMAFFNEGDAPGGDGEGWQRLRDLDTEPIENLAQQINSLVPFVLGLYLALALKRWWDLRVKALGAIFESLTSVCMLVSVELNEPKWKYVRATVAKFGIASIDLLVQAARQREDLERLVDTEFLSEVYVEALQKLSDPWERPLVCWAWIMRICMSAMDYNRTAAPRTTEVMKRCLAAKDGMLVMNMYLDTPLPFGYVHLITLLVNVQNLVMALKSGFVFAQHFALAQHFAMAQQVVTLGVVVAVYQGILQIACVIANPFGDNILNFPIAGYMNFMAKTVDAMSRAQNECPVVAENGRLHHPKAEGLDSTRPAR